MWEDPATVLLVPCLEACSVAACFESTQSAGGGGQSRDGVGFSPVPTVRQARPAVAVLQLSLWLGFQPSSGLWQDFWRLDFALCIIRPRLVLRPRCGYLLVRAVDCSR